MAKQEQRYYRLIRTPVRMTVKWCPRDAQNSDIA